jgi:hyaluronan-mediated motility receptor
MSSKTADKPKKENGLSVSPLDVSGSSSVPGSTAAASSTNGNGHGASSGGNISVCADSDGDSSIAAEDSLCVTPTRAKFKVPSQRPRTSKSEKRRSNASFSQDHSRAVELEREMRKLLSERNQLSKQLYSSKQDNAKLENKVQVAVRDKSALLSQMASLSKHNRDLSRGKDILLAKAFSSVDVKKARSLELSLKQANREKRAKQRELDRLEIQMNMTSKQMQERLLASLDEREEMENRIEDLECEVQHMAECQAAGEETNNELKASLAAQEEVSQSLLEKQNQLEMTIQEKEKEWSDERDRMTSETAELKSNLRSAEVKIDELDQVVISMEEQLSQTSQEANCLTTQLQSVKTELETEREEKGAVEGQLRQCRDLLQQEEEKTSTLEGNIADLSRLNSDLQTQLKCSQSELEGERGKRERVEKELTQSRAQLRETQEVVATLEERVTQSDQLNSDLQTQLTCEREKLEEERKEREEAEERLAVATTQLRDQETQRRHEQQEQAGALEAAHNKCSTLLTELEKAVSDGRETQALLRSQMSTLEAERQKAIEPYVTFTTLFPLPLLPLHLSQAVQTAEEVKETEAATRVQLAELEKRHTELEAVQSTALQQLEQAKEELISLQDQVDGPLSREVVAAVQEEMKKELEEVKTKLSQQTRVEDEMGKRVGELEEELERMTREREQLELAYLDLQEKCRPFQDQIEGLADVNALLKSQAALARREAQEVSDQFASLVGHQNTRQKIRYVKKIRDENTALKMEINELRVELSKQKKLIRKMNESKTTAAPHAGPPRPLSSKN